MIHGERRVQAHNWLWVEQILKHGLTFSLVYDKDQKRFVARARGPSEELIAKGTGNSIEWALDELEENLDEGL